MAYGVILRQTPKIDLPEIKQKISTVTVATSNKGTGFLYSTNDVDFYCNGSNDEEILSEAIDKAKEKNGKVFLLPGEYNLNIFSKQLIDIEIFGENNYDSQSTVIKIKNSSDVSFNCEGVVKFNNLVFDFGSNRVTTPFIQNNTYGRTYIDNVIFKGDVTAIQLSNNEFIEIKNCQFQQESRVVLNKFIGTAIIQDNIFTSKSSSRGIYGIEINSDSMNAVYIQNNNFGSSVIKYYLVPIKITKGNNIIIENNKLYGASTEGIEVDGRNNNIIIKNNYVSATSEAISFGMEVSNSIIDGNIIDSNNFGIMCDGFGLCNTITNNRIVNFKSGIDLGVSTKANLISNNLIYKGTTPSSSEYTIYLNGQNGLSLSNFIYGNLIPGKEVYVNGQIMNNTIENNKYN